MQAAHNPATRREAISKNGVPSVHWLWIAKKGLGTPKFAEFGFMILLSTVLILIINFLCSIRIIQPPRKIAREILRKNDKKKEIF